MATKNNIRANHLHYDIPESFKNKFLKVLALIIAFVVLAGVSVKILFL